MVSALDFRAAQHHQSVLLWRAHVSVNYWGHYLDESLPALIAAGAPQFGRATTHPIIFPEQAVPMGKVIVGTPVVVRGGGTITIAPSHTAFDKMQADTAATIDRFTAQARSSMLAPPVPSESGSPAPQAFEPTPAEAPRSRPSDGIIRLPPFIVADSRTHTHWLYAAVPGFEILSATTSEDTQNFAQSLYRQKQWVDEMAEPDLQARATVPTTLILLTEDFRKEMTGKVAELAKARREATSRLLSGVVALSAEDSGSELIPQVKLTDEDSTGVDVLLGPGQTQLALDPEFVFALLGNRRPASPLWFVIGVSSLWRDQIIAHNREKPGTKHFGPELGSVLYFPPLAALPDGADLLPIESLVGDPPPYSETERRTIWMAEAALFARWALDDSTGARRRAMWRFVEQSNGAGPNESLFKEVQVSASATGGCGAEAGRLRRPRLRSRFRPGAADAARGSLDRPARRERTRAGAHPGRLAAQGNRIRAARSPRVCRPIRRPGRPHADAGLQRRLSRRRAPGRHRPLPMRHGRRPATPATSWNKPSAPATSGRAPMWNWPGSVCRPHWPSPPASGTGSIRHRLLQSSA